MIESLLGSRAAERVALYLAYYEEGYARAIASNFEIPINSVQLQLNKLEAAGVLVSQLKGRTRIFTWSPRFPLRQELVALLKRALELLPEDERKRYFSARTRPRRTGKPL